MSFEERTYRSLVNRKRFRYFEATHLETDILAGVSHNISPDSAKQIILKSATSLREILDSYINENPVFRSTLKPVPLGTDMPEPVAALVRAANIAGTGPMAGIAGLFSSYAGTALLTKYAGEEIILENGGDIYCNITGDLNISVFAGNSPLSNKIHISIPPGEWGICTSSGTVGPSLSFGKADAVTVLSENAVVADALATSICNMVKSPDDILPSLEIIEQIEEIKGLIIIVGDRIGIRGNITIC